MGWSWLWALLLAVAARRDAADLWARWARAGGAPRPCLDARAAAAAPLTVYSADGLDHWQPRAGMDHVTLAGGRHHGLRHFEAWLQSMAPGAETPVHSHPPPCEEVNFVLAGRGVARARDAAGRLREWPLAPNTTVIAPPGRVWQVANTGGEDLRVVVVVGCAVPGIRFFESWAGSAGLPAADLAVMPWNDECPAPLRPIPPAP